MPPDGRPDLAGCPPGGPPPAPPAIWPQVRARSDAARRSGALRPVVTRIERLRTGGIEFLVRVASGLEAKDAARRGARGAADPFAEPEPELFVAALSPTHYCLLNKFNVIDEHLLVATYRFVDQRAPLAPEDFAALEKCMRGHPVLGFYNGGRAAGASQLHRHLQVVPLPLAPGDAPRAPIEVLLGRLRGSGVQRSTALPFRHAFTRTGMGAGAARAHAACTRLLAAEGLRAAPGSGDLAPYSLLIAAQWMLLVPRRRDEVDGIPVNALGYAGSLLVRDERGLARLREAGPLAVLARAALQ